MAIPATQTVDPPPSGTVPEPPPEPPPPPTDFSGMSLPEYEAHLKAQADGTTPPAGETPPPEAGETPPKDTKDTKATPPVPEDEDDPEIQAEIDKAEPPPTGETPQNKSARTKRNRRKAQKAYATRVTRERDEARQELQQFKARPPREPARTPPPPPPPPPTEDTYTGSDPKDPVPKQEDFNGDDHAYFRASVAHEVRAQGRIDRHQSEQARTRASSVERERTESQDIERRIGVVQSANAKYAETHADFDETTKDVVYGPDVIFASADLDDPSAVLYHLAKHPSDLAEIRQQFTSNPRSAMVRLGRLEATIQATRETPPKPSTAPTPPVQTVAGATTASETEPEFASMNLQDYEKYLKRQQAG